MSGRVIEPATADDVDRMVELWLALVEHGRDHGLHLLAAPNRTIARETLAAAAANDRAFVARDGDRIVGFANCSLDRGAFETDVSRGVVDNVYVLPRYRGEGIGSDLVTAAERRLADLDVDVVAVETMADDDRIEAFYRERGYSPQRTLLERRVETHRKPDPGATE